VETTVEPDCSHSHVFGQDLKRPGELRSIIVIVITGTMMVVEVAAGILYGSMALLADGLHMASHAAALTINALAYIYARRHAHDRRFSFGTGKINSLGGFTGAILLAVFALFMVWESVARFISPVPIAYNQAIFVAVLGLVVNAASMFILGHGEHDRPLAGCGEENTHGHFHHHDHNLRAAYLHVLADALTSFLAIFALTAAKYLGVDWLDPLMGIVGAALVTRWSLGLLQVTSWVLLDRQGPGFIQQKIVECITADSQTRVTDLHLWSIGPNIYCVVIEISTSDASKTPEDIRGLLPPGLGLAHVTVEIHGRDKH